MPDIKEGLEGVVIGETSLSSIDGVKGKLIYRGYDIKDLAENSNFEEVVYLLWFGKLPTQLELKQFQNKLRKERDIDSSCIPILKKGAKNMSAMDALMTITSYLSQFDPDLNNDTPESNIKKAIKLTAKYPTIVAYFWRLRNGKHPIPPKTNLGHGENFLYMLTGKVPTKTEARAIELDFLLTAEHGINASTFATLVATSTLTDIHSAMLAGLATLKGPLHGAAREKVYQMLDSIGSENNVSPWLKQAMKNKERIMGFGHRVYKTYDPRALIFKDISKQLADESKNKKWYSMSAAIEDFVIKEVVQKKGKPIYPNVDFYTGAVYKYLNIPIQLSTGIFAIGRIAGWTAHFLEQREHNRLIRPKANYIGKRNMKYIPIEKR